MLFTFLLKSKSFSFNGLIEISNGTPAAIVNPLKIISKVPVLADISWKPNDDEMENVTFTKYDWKKWKNNDGE